MSQSSPVPSWRSPVWLVLMSMGSIHFGAAIAKGLFAQVSPIGVVSLRLGLGAVVLLVLVRPRWRHYSLRNCGGLVLLGLTMGLMNTLFYSAIAYIPIGTAVTLEFVGPLGVALFHSQRRRDWLWVAMAAAGVLLLAPVGGGALHPLGVTLALLAGSCWAAYIVLANRVARAFPGSEGTALAMTVGAIAVVPFGIAAEGTNLLNPAVLMLGLAVAVLSSALPYSLEMAALRQMPVKVFGVLMSLEPAVASMVGLLVLGEQLSLRMVAAIALVSFASAGSTFQPKPPA